MKTVGLKLDRWEIMRTTRFDIDVKARLVVYTRQESYIKKIKDLGLEWEIIKGA